MNSLPENASDLLSAEAGEHLEEMAQAAHALTVRRFGRTIKLYAPVYISNECINGCSYCGFRAKNAIERRTLTAAETIREAEEVIGRGHRHLLLVSGENPKAVPIELIEDVARSLRPKVAGLAIEVQPFDEAGYRRLAKAGIDGVTLYQETYDEEAYRAFHPSGPKANHGTRIAAIDAAGRAGMRFLGIGALLGLSDWRREALSLIEHARSLMRTHWRSHITISVPRVRDCASGFQPPHPVGDRDLAHMICALRLALPDAGIILSTREPERIREYMLPLGITQMSAGSSTSPGGYTEERKSTEQFHLEDTRDARAFADILSNKGYDPVWKDWESKLYG
jgi:2-iminoacetate synthase